MWHHRFTKKWLASQSISLGFASALFASTATPLWAFETADVVKRLGELAEIYDLTLSYDEPLITGDDVTLNNLKVNIPDEDDVFLGTIKILGVSEADDDAISVEKLHFNPLNYSIDEITLQFGEMTLENFEWPSVEDFQSGQIQPNGSFELDGFSLSIEGNKIVSIARASGAKTGNFPDEAMKQTFNMSDVNVDVTNLPDAADAKKVLNELGYDELNFNVISKGTWDPSGVVDVNEFALIGDDIGTLNFTLNVGGYTADVAQKITELQLQANGSNDQAVALQMLGVLQGLTLNTGQLKFTDDSITDKAINFIAPQMGTDSNGLKAQAKGFLPFILGRLGDPELVQMVTQAVGAYLDDPKSIQIDLAPDAPVGFGEIMGASLAAPQTLPNVLGAKVLANQ